jgi:hypothetical protein
VGKRRFLLIVAVAEYEGWALPPLPGVHRDAARLRHTMEHWGDIGVFRTHWLLNSNARKEAICSGLRDIAACSNCTDQIILYFGGHGLRHWDHDESRWAHCLIPYDATFETARDRGISKNELGGLIDSLPAQEIVAIFDCCYSGGIAGLEWNPSFLNELARIVNLRRNCGKKSPLSLNRITTRSHHRENAGPAHPSRCIATRASSLSRSA